MSRRRWLGLLAGGVVGLVFGILAGHFKAGEPDLYLLKIGALLAAVCGAVLAGNALDRAGRMLLHFTLGGALFGTEIRQGKMTFALEGAFIGLAVGIVAASIQTDKGGDGSPHVGKARPCSCGKFPSHIGRKADFRQDSSDD
jgi:hypothetical protein